MQVMSVSSKSLYLSPVCHSALRIWVLCQMQLVSIRNCLCASTVKLKQCVRRYALQILAATLCVAASAWLFGEPSIFAQIANSELAVESLQNMQFHRVLRYVENPNCEKHGIQTCGGLKKHGPGRDDWGGVERIQFGLAPLRWHHKMHMCSCHTHL